VDDPDDPEATIETDIPNEQWKIFFSRLHAPQRYTKEKDFLYLYAHRVIQTNGVKSLYEYVGDEKTKPDCRRCAADDPAFESRRHAFFECPSVLSLWCQVLDWIELLQPESKWSDDANQILLCWPEQEKIHPVVVHLHSVASNTVWRTYCKLGDKEALYKNQLHWMVYYAFKHRAKVELARALYKDQKRREACTTGAALRLFSQNPDQYYNKMKEEWDLPPHIAVTKSGVTFGEIWETLPLPAEDEDEREE